MSDFKKMCVTFSILKLQKCDAYQNGVEYFHKPKSNDVNWPPPLFFLTPSLELNLDCLGLLGHSDIIYTPVFIFICFWKQILILISKIQVLFFLEIHQEFLLFLLGVTWTIL